MLRKDGEELVDEYSLPLIPSDVVLGIDTRQSCFKRVLVNLGDLVPYGGFLSATFTLSSATLGAGVITLPSAFNFSGIIPSFLLLLIVTLATIYAVRLLVETRELTRLGSYEAMARTLFGPGWDYLSAGLMWLFTFGTCVAYIISIGDILDSAFMDDSIPSYLRSQGGKRLITVLIWFLGMFTTSLPRSINSLRYASIVAILSLLFFIACVVVHALQNGFRNGKIRKDIHFWRTGNIAIEGLSLFMFAYLCQVNSLEIYEEIIDPTVKKMTTYTASGMFFCFIAYSITGFFGYADFGPEIKDSIIKHYDIDHNLLLAISLTGIGFQLCVGFALCMQPARESFYYALGWDIATIPTYRHVLFCGTQSLAALTLGLLIPSVNIVFGLLGSLCGGILGFCLPALYRMYCGNWSVATVGIVNYVCTYLLLIAGVVAVVFGTGASVYGVVV
ncbi:putative amino acid transporter PAT4 [Trypanosoma conorhini]|uniref:Putative amino acid transporter PAT4 n=1 Tax=Trypanosoma conorhini TaxID=83891 RepID=A0A3R7LF65_9TRYP|nr:putative amino acid transporter PAT4 [Trypanosoma conorhini]RNF27206.1 putative amino acid transporter PAT4 [Trypanosoma conorhini]